MKEEGTADLSHDRFPLPEPSKQVSTLAVSSRTTILTFLSRWQSAFHHAETIDCTAHYSEKKGEPFRLIDAPGLRGSRLASSALTCPQRHIRLERRALLE